MHISRRRRLAGLLAAGLLAGSCSVRSQSTAPSRSPSPPSPAASTASPTPAAVTSTAAPSTIPPGPAPPALAWRSCPPGAYQCAAVDVPLDWSRPTAGPTVRLGLIRLPVSGARSQRIGSLFVNPGGPGGSAVDFVRGIDAVLPPPLLRRFDIVAFDPRGVGSSQPLACESGAALDAYLAMNPAPSTDAEIAAVAQADQQFAAGCTRQYGKEFLAHLDTMTAARDMDLVRAALGEATLTYVGYSYGTFLGAEYANLFPTHVRAFVLDGAVDPSLAGLQFDVQQAIGFEKELGDYFNACVPGCPFSSGGNPRGAFMALMQQVTAHPLQVGSRQLTLALFLNGVAYGLYRPDLWPSLSKALQAAARGDGAQLLSMSDALTDRSDNGTYDALTSVLPAVNCVDSPYPTNVADYRAEAARVAQQAPVFGASLVWGSLVCAYWPVPPVIRPGPLHAAGAPPILVIGTTADPATPYQWAQALASQLEKGVLLTHVGDGHTSLGTGSGCVDGAVTSYLITLAPPAKDSVCGNGNGPPSPPANGGTVGYMPEGHRAAYGGVPAATTRPARTPRQ